jgi:hypothetical protein
VSSPPGGKAVPPCPIDQIIGLYHDRLPACPRVLVRNAKRDKFVSGRWRQLFADGQAVDADSAMAALGEFFGYCAESKFLTGKAKPNGERTPFMADLEWLMSPTNFAKTIEGRYHR